MNRARGPVDDWQIVKSIIFKAVRQPRREAPLFRATGTTRNDADEGGDGVNDTLRGARTHARTHALSSIFTLSSALFTL